MCWGGKCQTFGRCSVKGLIARVVESTHGFFALLSTAVCAYVRRAVGGLGTCIGAGWRPDNASLRQRGCTRLFAIPFHTHLELWSFTWGASLRILEADTCSPEEDFSMGKGFWVGCLALAVAQQRLHLGVLFKCWNRESHRGRHGGVSAPDTTWAELACGAQGPGTLLSQCPLCSLQGSSRALISAARNTTAAPRRSHPSSTTMASGTTDSTPSPTAAVMPG